MTISDQTELDTGFCQCNAGVTALLFPGWLNRLGVSMSRLLPRRLMNRIVARVIEG